MPSGSDTESDLLSRCIGELYSLASSDWHEEEDYADVEARLLKVTRAIAPDEAWQDFRKKLAVAVQRTEDDDVAEIEFEADGPHTPMVFRQRRARRVARLAESFRDDWRLSVFKPRAEAAAGTERVRSPVKVLDQLADRFHLVAQRLIRRYGGRETLRITDEYDVQDLLHALLLLEFEDVRPEEHTPSYAGRSARVDFLLKAEQIVVEVKCAREGLSSKEIGDQLLIDIGRYRAHRDCKILFCFVYDPAGRLDNPRGLENDLSSDRHGLLTYVRVRPRSS